MLRIWPPFVRSLPRRTYDRCILRFNSQHVTRTADSPIDTTNENVEVGASPEFQEQKKLPCRQPLVKNFFVGVVDKELLAFPEVIERDDMKRLQNEILPIQDFLTNEVDVKVIETTHVLPVTLMDEIRKLGLYGINVPNQYDGRNWNWSASLKATEPEASFTDLAAALTSHRVVIDMLNELGTESQKQKYLKKLGEGSLIATEAVYEYNQPQDDLFKTTADYNSESQNWILNGEKAFVVTGPIPSGATQLFLVVAQTNRMGSRNDAGLSTTIFLVDSNTPGVVLGECHITSGCRGMTMGRVKFQQVKLPESSIVGSAHDGAVVGDILLRSSRLRSSMVALGMTKQLINNLTEYSVDTKQCGVSVKDLEITKVHLSKAVANAYAMESMIYFTAGLFDEFDKQDILVESAITKYFAFNNLYDVANVLKDMMGQKSLQSGHIADIALRNAAHLTTQGESMDTLNMYISLSGLQHAGMLLNDTVKKSRNPLFHPGHIFSKFMQGSNIDHPKTDMRLGDNLHPSLASAAQYLEHSVARLLMAVELLLTRYGQEIIERHTETRRLTEMSTAIYAIFASCSRASRSYCIGLHLADHEILLANTIATIGHNHVKKLCEEIFHGQFMNSDNNLRRLSEQILKSKRYFPVHPLTYNF